VQPLDLAFPLRFGIVADTRIEGARSLLQKLLLLGVNLVRVNLVALRQIGYSRLLPQRLQRNPCLQRCVDLPSRSLRHHPLRLATERPISNQARGPKSGVHFNHHHHVHDFSAGRLNDQYSLRDAHFVGNSVIDFGKIIM
jgi:hypothetical protein